MLLIIDGNSILNRAFYGIRPLTARDGLFTHAVYGFLQILESIRKEISPDAVAVAFDVKRHNFRHELYEGYKGSRKGMPEELAVQLPYCKQVLEALGCTLYGVEGYEADDIIGTFAAHCRRSGEQCVIATGDRDSLQLVGDGVSVRLARTSMGKAESVLYDEARIGEEYGVTPSALIDIKALMGDSSDEIPGVAGIGQKTACQLIADFGSLDGVYENLDDARIRPAVRTKLENGREMAYLSRKLGTICCEVPVEIDLAAVKAKQPDRAALKRLLVRLEFFKMIDKYGLTDVEAGEAPSETPSQLRAERTSADVDTLAKDALASKMLSLRTDGEELLCESAKYRASCRAEQLRCVLEEESVAKTVHDLKTLHKALSAQGIVLRGPVFDVMLAAYLINPLASGYEYGRLCEEHGTESLLELGAALEKEIDAQELRPLLDGIETPLAVVLAEAESAGFLIDREGLEAYGGELRRETARVQAEIYDLAGCEFNINSPKQLGVLLFETLGLPHARKTKTGYSTDAEVLEGLRFDHPIVDKILTFRQYNKLLSTYCDGLLKLIAPDGRIHTRFNQTETRTGRISSLEPNLQNIPVRTELGSRLRDFFVAPEGCVLLDADYSQIELRVLAALSGDEKMLSVFAEEGDIHAKPAAEVFGVPPELVTSALRSQAKAVNFGIVYGIGAFSLSKNIHVSVAEADAYIKNYFAAYPKVSAYLNGIVERAKADGYVTTHYGRRRPMPELTSSNFNQRSFGERAAKNTAIQGTAADIIKLAMVKVSQQLKKAGLKARLILQVHDELIVEAPLDEQQRAAEILRESMESAAELAVRLRADVSQGKTWLEAKE